MTIKVSKVSGRLDLSQVLTELGKRGVGAPGAPGASQINTLTNTNSNQHIFEDFKGRNTDLSNFLSLSTL